MNVFIDTNVLMDVLLERRPFVVESRKVWFLAERGKVTGLVSALSFPSIYYVVRKALEGDTAVASEKLTPAIGSCWPGR
jgi:predicted nucleic acid-binding protein